jgi:hypothetical protein
MLASKHVTYRRQQERKKRRKEERKDKLRSKHGTIPRIPQLSVLSKSRANCGRLCGMMSSERRIRKHNELA